MLENIVPHGSLEKRGPHCTKCESKMKLSHVVAHSRVGMSFERRTFYAWRVATRGPVGGEQNRERALAIQGEVFVAR
jgi:hypothetical protein